MDLEGPGQNLRSPWNGGCGGDGAREKKRSNKASDATEVTWNLHQGYSTYMKKEKGALGPIRQNGIENP